MKPHRFRLMFYLSIIVISGCAQLPPTTPESVATVPPTPEILSVKFETSDIPKAQSFSMASNANGVLYIVHGRDNSLFVSRSADGGKTFGTAILASGDTPVHVLPIEHPAIAVDDHERAGVTWLEVPPDYNGAKIWYAVSEDGGQSFHSAQLVATEPEGEVAMVQAALDDNGNPFLTWLNGSELKFSRSFDQGFTFSEVKSIGDGSCECCQLQVIVKDGGVFIAYRSLESGGDKGDIRDIVMIHSNDEGETFQPVTRVSDTHWYLPACPIAGPSLVLHNKTFYIAWMDGRSEPPGQFRRGDIWLSTSHDGGQTFLPNIRINADQDMHYTLPSIAVGPGGRLHITWEAHAQDSNDTFLYYTISDDGGRIFAVPQVIANNEDPTLGSPGKPLITVDASGHVTLTWLDRSGVRIATWVDTK